jgi:hypothetical protein
LKSVAWNACGKSEGMLIGCAIAGGNKVKRKSKLRKEMSFMVSQCSKHFKLGEISCQYLCLTGREVLVTGLGVNALQI